MNFLMLRGQVPQDRNPQEIVFDRLKTCDDVWTHLFYNIVYDNYGELCYWGGRRNHLFVPNFMERWVPTFDEYIPTFEPDVIFCRGGFPEYHVVLKRFPKAIKIYYGAGRRFLPQKGFSDYDIILQDSPEQVKKCKKKFPNALTTLFIKPAADNIFYPTKSYKEYDICFPANGAQAFKGHKFVYKTIPNHFKLLNLGNNPRGYKYPKNVSSYRALRSDMANNISKCKVGIVTTEGNIDSCPRVVPELLACGLPIVVLDSVRFWKEKYIVSGVTGELATTKNFWDTVQYVLDNVDKYNPRDYYKENLSLAHAAKFIREKINEVMLG